MEPRTKHPKTCRICNGTGWQPGRPIHTHANGDPVTYTTSEPCQHDWWKDDPDVDEYGYDRTTPITFTDYYTRLVARSRLDMQARDEMEAWDRWLTTPARTRWTEDTNHTPPPPPLHQRRVGKTIIDPTQFF